MKDFLILDIQSLLAASKNKKYRETIYLYHRVLIDFFQNSCLTTKTLLESGLEVPDDFEIMKSDLTEEGYELVQKYLDKWSNAINSGKIGVTDTSVLEKGLKKIRNEK